MPEEAPEVKLAKDGFEQTLAPLWVRAGEKPMLALIIEGDRIAYWTPSVVEGE